MVVQSRPLIEILAAILGGHNPHAKRYPLVAILTLVCRSTGLSVGTHWYCRQLNGPGVWRDILERGLLKSQCIESYTILLKVQFEYTMGARMEKQGYPLFVTFSKDMQAQTTCLSMPWEMMLTPQAGRSTRFSTQS